MSTIDWAAHLPVIWAGIAVVAVVMYVLLDGFDLGIGILFPYAGNDDDRDVMMNTVAPIWDGNETWLVLGGGGMLAAFPVAYATILPGTYLPLLVMLIALIFRGVAFEFRFKARTSRHVWDRSFHYGSLFATFAQGLVLGSFIQGFEVENRTFVGGPFDWLTPFTVLCGVALVAGYALLGCTWLIWRTEGHLREWCAQLCRPLLLAVMIFVGIVSLWTPFLDNDIAMRWFTMPNLLYLSPVPVVTFLVALGLWRTGTRRHDVVPFLLAMSLFLLSFLGLGISLWPNVVPPDISIWEAAAPPASQGFMLAGMVFLVPLVICYTVFCYYVFRGKVRPGEGYHH
ncbi:cytochrome d ubiquinol oxidase subunit II [Marinivivus vitaminiproducens]|uniref:cytochrome d ubiquinol oxidase subunit II n=1 Tax=Marinivivus vitaminiproducens TaxID=3035935 RepID=UPI0027A96A85|nr:cytochrome d ubiquinol oxidase subunit II [Geminicoccaceae bacterium SCSIO 64248]